MSFHQLFGSTDLFTPTVLLLDFVGSFASALLSGSCCRQAFRHSISCRVLKGAPEPVVLAALARRSGLCYLDLGGCGRDGPCNSDAAFLRIMDAVRASGATLQGLQLAGVPLGARSAQRLRQSGLSPWAFPADRLERGVVLVSQPDIAKHSGVEHYDKAVILLISHSPDSGSEGLILNQPTSMQLRDFLKTSGGQVVPRDPRARVGKDGAVSSLSPEFDASLLHFGGDFGEELLLIHGHVEVGGTEVSPNVFVTGSCEHFALAKRSILKGRHTVASFRLVLGFCQWDAGCLQQELRAGLWHAAHCSSCFLMPPSADVAGDVWSDLKILVT